MCLYVNNEATKKFLNKHKGEYIMAYKVAQIRDGKVKGVYQSDYEYKVGVNKSNSQRKKVVFKGTLERGIHVCLSENEVETHISDYNTCVVIRVRCYLKDFLGADGTQAAFRKIHISEKAMRKALQEKRVGRYSYLG